MTFEIWTIKDTVDGSIANWLPNQESCINFAYPLVELTDINSLGYI